MITKAEIISINQAGTRCVVNMPLFQSASSSSPVTAEALVSIAPGLFNSLFVGDIVFVSFEENALEKPIILGKLFRGVNQENTTPGGAGILNYLRVNNSAIIPSSTLYQFPTDNQNEYKNLNTPKKVADFCKWLERLLKSLITQLDDNFRCFKNWLLWKLKPENIEIDDGDLDSRDYTTKYEVSNQDNTSNCTICGSSCIKNKKRQYLKVDTNKEYPNL